MKVTMYDLLGLVKDGKAPKKVKYINSIWEYDKETKDYFNDGLWLIYSMNSIGLTERKVEIIEEEPTQEEIKEYTNKFLEAWEPVKKQFGKLFDELLRIGNDFNLEDESEEEKKIPEKLKSLNNVGNVPNLVEFADKQQLNNHLLKDKLNEVIHYLQYLKSKGE